MAKRTSELCAQDDCYDAAIGGHLASPNDLCRSHWREAVKDEVVKCEVVGPATIVSYDDIDVTKGGIVELHPGDTKIGQLVVAGYIKVLPAQASAKAIKTTKAL